MKTFKDMIKYNKFMVIENINTVTIHYSLILYLQIHLLTKMYLQWSK